MLQYIVCSWCMAMCCSALVCGPGGAADARCSHMMLTTLKVLLGYIVSCWRWRTGVHCNRPLHKMPVAACAP